MSIRVHHLNLSRSFRILWMLEELELDYEIKAWQRNAGFRAPEEARRIHPLGRFPVVEVDGQVLAESGAILEYFAEREGKLRPSDPDGRLRYTFFMHHAEGSVMPPLLMQLILERTRTAPLPFFIKPVVKAITRRMEDGYSGPAVVLHFDYLEQSLADCAHFAGDAFSMADIQMYYPVEAGLARGAGQRPQLTAWLARVRARPAFQRALAKGGPALPS